MSDVPTAPKPSSVSQGLLDRVVVGMLAKFVDRIPLRWKTAIGLLLILLSWGFRAWMVPAYPDRPELATVADWSETLAWSLFGIGVLHKAYKADPPKPAG